jgi:hypothetical protein
MTSKFETQERITVLEQELQTLSSEVVSLKGRMAGRKEPVAQKLRAENKAAKERLELLIQIAHSLSLDALQPTEEGAAKVQLEEAKKALVDFCTQTKIDEKVWKKLAS